MISRAVTKGRRMLDAECRCSRDTVMNTTNNTLCRTHDGELGTTADCKIIPTMVLKTMIDNEER